MLAPFPASTALPAAIDGIEVRVEPGLADYAATLAEMEALAGAIHAGDAAERVWLVEHPPLYTAGTSADPAEMIDPRFPVHVAGRGGRYTYHGPGQRVGYLMLDLGRRGRDVRRFVSALERWLIATLGDLGISAHAAPGRIGIWVGEGAREAKIGAIGVRVKRWVTLHGFAVNLSPDLTHFGGIVPCGIAEYPVTSAQAMGHPIDFARFDAALIARMPEFLSAIATPCPGESGAKG